MVGGTQARDTGREAADGMAVELLRLPGAGVSLEAIAFGPRAGPLVLMLHGFPETRDAWRRVAPMLAAAGLRVVAPDQRGYGGSDKPHGAAAYALDRLAADLLALASALGRERFRVVGHDWGGIVAWHLAAHAPERVERAAILNAPHPDAFRAHARSHPAQLLRSGYMAFFQLPLLPELALSAGGFALLRSTMVGSARKGALSEALLARYGEAWARPGALGAMLDWYRALPRSMGGPWPRVRVPVRVVWGDRDPFLDARLAEASLAPCDAGEARHLPQATHWLHHEEPREVARLLVEFLV